MNETACCALAVQFVTSLGRTNVRVISTCLADLETLARHHRDAEVLLKINNPRLEVRLLCDFPSDWKQKVLYELDEMDRIVAERFFEGEDEMLVVCDEKNINFHTWLNIALD